MVFDENRFRVLLSSAMIKVVWRYFEVNKIERNNTSITWKCYKDTFTQIPFNENKTWVLLYSIMLFVVQYYYAVNETKVDSNNEIIINLKHVCFQIISE